MTCPHSSLPQAVPVLRDWFPQRGLFCMRGLVGRGGIERHLTHIDAAYRVCRRTNLHFTPFEESCWMLPDEVMGAASIQYATEGSLAVCNFPTLLTGGQHMWENMLKATPPCGGGFV